MRDLQRETQIGLRADTLLNGEKESKGAFSHSDDYHSVNLNGKNFSLTSRQARATETDGSEKSAVGEFMDKGTAESADKDSDEFNVLEFGGPEKGKELCIIRSYFRSGQHDLRKLAMILKNKAHIRYRVRGEKRDPLEWYKSNPEGFRNHTYKIRKKAEEHPKRHLISGDYWESYK